MIKTQQETSVLQIVMVVKDQGDVSSVTTAFRKGEIWMPWLWQSTRWSYFTLVKHFQHELLREQCYFQQDKAQNKNTWFITFKDVAGKPHENYCFDDPLIIPEFYQLILPSL